MPTITSAVSNLKDIGPVLDCQLAISRAAEQALTKAGQPIPSPLPVSMQVDTGASNSMIQTGLAQKLGLQPVGTASINTPSSHNVSCDVYAVRLLLSSSVTVTADVTAIEAPLQGQTIHGLIGRDLLSVAVFVYLGRENQFTLAF